MVSDSLHLIETWLATHAPRILHVSLNPGASEEALAALEKVLGRPLPDDYKALYRWHNGLDEEVENFGNFVYGLSFLPLEEVAANFHSRTQHTEAVPLEHTTAEVRADHVLNPYWLSLGFDGSHAWLYVDLDPTPAGTYGQVIFLDEVEETAFLVADSVTSLLTGFAQDLQQGLYSLNPDALEEDDNEFLAPDPTIDLVNWYNASRWQSVPRP
ncbi:SMI1/KNR4 family protein [Hymenobacter sp. J193]|uniref:SMI1/KNR4 family protein n=1 Tax=Hymenobacter sp. J193 TaxID=2898429 RepID=UPI002150CA03|nr:SMI1/KNR4 family protein [Hymenobacter sp. J193]MCR5890038.1 SMI1/KNR4 family protein [Hymenobacter sp. J193]